MPLKKISLLYFIWFCSFPSLANTPQNSLHLRYFQGEILKFNPSLKHLVRGPALGIELLYEQQTFGDRPWHHHYNFPRLGVGLKTFDFGFPDSLGYAFVVYPYLKFPLLRTSVFDLHYKVGVGLGYHTKIHEDAQSYYLAGGKYWLNVLTSNMITGSRLNTYLNMGLQIVVPFVQDFAISSEFGISHLSNGNLAAPNLGINIVTASVGVRYKPGGAQELPARNPSEGAPPEQWGFEISTSTGAREAFLLLPEFFPVATVSAALYFTVNRRFRMGIGCDGFYDAAYNPTITQVPNYNRTPYDAKQRRYYLQHNDPERQYRVGVSIRPEFMIGRLSGSIHLGAYVYDPVRNYAPAAQARIALLDKPLIYPYKIIDEDGWFYTRFLMRYDLDGGWFLQAGMKNHLSMAEFVELGIGVRIASKKRKL